MIYDKVEIDVVNKTKNGGYIVKEYIPVYLLDNHKDNFLHFHIIPQPSHFILAKEPYKIIYIKKNNKQIDISDATTLVEEFKMYNKYEPKTFLNCSIKLDDNDLRKKLIIIELCFELELKVIMKIDLFM